MVRAGSLLFTSRSCHQGDLVVLPPNLCPRSTLHHSHASLPLPLSWDLVTFDGSLWPPPTTTGHGLKEPWSITESLDGRGLFSPVPAQHREDSSVSGVHHPVHLLPSASPCLEGPDPGGSPFSLPGREPALACSPNAPRPPVTPRDAVR